MSQKVLRCWTEEPGRLYPVHGSSKESDITECLSTWNWLDFEGGSESVFLVRADVFTIHDAEMKAKTLWSERVCLWWAAALHCSNFATIFTIRPHQWKLLSHVWLFAAPWTVACQAPLSMEFSRPEYWSGQPAIPLSRGSSQLRNNTNLLPSSSRDQKFRMDWRDGIPSGGSRRESISLPFPVSRGCLNFLLHLQTQQHSICKFVSLWFWSSFLTLSLLRIFMITLDPSRKTRIIQDLPLQTPQLTHTVKSLLP